jgi:type I restriction-modification system DNA methylase subunit
MTTKQTFSSLMLECGQRFDLQTVFDDLLTIALCTLSFNPVTGESYDEDLYAATIQKYADDDARFLFPKAFTLLVDEMGEARESGGGLDVVGMFYEEHLSGKPVSQYFPPWEVCQLVAAIAMPRIRDRRVRVLDPNCCSGRLLVASAFSAGPEHYYYGVSSDMLCVKMSALNLFLNGIFHGEIMCADPLKPGDFQGSYTLSLLPFGVRFVRDKEHSPLWKFYKDSLGGREDLVPDETEAKIRVF